MTDIEIFLRLAVALAVGLLIGLERGRSERTTPEAVNRRITGMRTFGLIGLLCAACRRNTFIISWIQFSWFCRINDNVSCNRS